MTRTLAALATVALLAFAPAANADKGGGHPGDTSPGNSGQHKTTICHHAGPTKVITITVDDHALKAHFAHGDSVGACPPTPTPTETTPTPTPTEPAPTPPAATTPPVTVPDTTPSVPQPAPEQLVSPDRRAGHVSHKHKAVAKRQRFVAAQRALHRRAAQARVESQLPHTGFPAALIALLGSSVVALGFGLRKLT